MISDKKKFQAILELRKDSPHLFMTLDVCNIKEVSVKWCDTAYAAYNTKDNMFEIGLDSKFTENLDSKNLSALLQHELYHIVFGHCSDTYFLDDPDLGMVAKDLIINDCITLFRDKTGQPELIDGCLHLGDFNHKFNTTFNSRKHTSREIYDWLRQNKNSPEVKKFLGKHNPTDSLVAVIDGENTPSDKPGEGESPKIKEKVSGVLEKIAEEKEEDKGGREHGNLPAELEREIEKYLLGDYDFLQVFERVIQKSLKRDKKNTWKKPSRRYGSASKGKIKLKKPMALFLVDTSGSMTKEILSKIYSQIEVIAKFYDLWVCWGDTGLEGYKKIKRGEGVNIKFKGGGGTDLSFYKEMLSKDTFDLIVFDTDGYIPSINDTDKIQKIFCIYSNGPEVKGYKNIRIK